jgi:NAD(P)H-dependent FMN reductase
MPHIAIISPSVRKGRISHRVALYFRDFLKEKKIEIELLDLMMYNFPVFEERLKYIESPSALMIDFAGKIKAADGVIIITPEYNGGYPASLKNVVDLLTDEWRRKPVVFVTVSNGNFAGTQVITSIQFALWKLGAITVPSTLRLPNITTAFDESGMPAGKAELDKKATTLVDDLLWFIEAKKRMDTRRNP